MTSQTIIQEIFEDLMSRFIINVPEEEISSTDRICFQIEQAHWYYEDFLRETEPLLPGFTLKRFAEEMFLRCPLISGFIVDNNVEEIYKRFVAYKMNIPVCGAIILNEAMDKILLVRGWNARSTWTFPKGKINHDESDVHCAIREVMEEVGLDVTSQIKEHDFIEIVLRGEQRNRLYIIHPVSENYKFETQTRKEIGDIKWHPVHSLPRFNRATTTADSKFYMIKRFMNDITRWIKAHRNLISKNNSSNSIGMSKSLDDQVIDHSKNLKNLLGIGRDIDNTPRESIYATPLKQFPLQFNSPLPEGLVQSTLPLDGKQVSLLSILRGSSTQRRASTSSAHPSSLGQFDLNPAEPNREQTFQTFETHQQSTLQSSAPIDIPAPERNNTMELLGLLRGTGSTPVSAPAFPQSSQPSVSSNEHLKSLVGILSYAKPSSSIAAQTVHGDVPLTPSKLAPAGQSKNIPRTNNKNSAQKQPSNPDGTDSPSDQRRARTSAAKVKNENFLRNKSEPLLPQTQNNLDATQVSNTVKKVMNRKMARSVTSPGKIQNQGKKVVEKKMTILKRPESVAGVETSVKPTKEVAREQSAPPPAEDPKVDNRRSEPLPQSTAEACQQDMTDFKFNVNDLMNLFVRP